MQYYHSNRINPELWDAQGGKINMAAVPVKRSIDGS